MTCPDKTKTHFLFPLFFTLLGLVACNSPTSAEQALQSGPSGQSRTDNYNEAKRLFWGRVYAKGGETLYCGEVFGSRRSKEINVEHVMPMSWAMKKFNCKERNSCRNSQRFRQIESDMHNFYPSRRDINQIRGSFPFAIVQGEKRQFGQCDFEVDTRYRVVEPRPEVRGDIARAMFYMYDQYNIRIHVRQAKMLKQWNRQDPPNAFEIKRNNTIAKLQGSRNRFIDDPTSVDRLRF